MFCFLLSSIYAHLCAASTVVHRIPSLFVRRSASFSVLGGRNSAENDTYTHTHTDHKYRNETHDLKDRLTHTYLHSKTKERVNIDMEYVKLKLDAR